MKSNNFNNFNEARTLSSESDNLSKQSAGNDKEWLSTVYRMTSDYFIPFLLPAATAFAGWLANRKYAAKVQQNEVLKGELTRLLEEIKEGQKVGNIFSVEDGSKRMDIIREEDREVSAIHKDLEEISQLLQERQDIYCSVFTRRKLRHQIEEDLKGFAFSRKYDKDIRLYRGLVDIFQYDNHCDSYGSHRNGCVMWVYMDMWRNMARLRKYQRIESRLSDKEA
ncbi:coiled-coil domain-containing protein 127-like isoform X2 [Apostichopus japonicus]